MGLNGIGLGESSGVAGQELDPKLSSTLHAGASEAPNPNERRKLVCTYVLVAINHFDSAMEGLAEIG